MNPVVNRSVKVWIFLCALVAVVSAGAVPAGAAVSVGDRPALNLELIDGRRVTSADLRGRLVILEFWATWCGPCVAQIPHLKELHATYADQGVVLISVSLDRAKKTAERFIEDNEMTWAHVHDPSQDRPMAREWGVRGIPRAFLISPAGEVLWAGHPARIDEPLKEALQTHPPRQVVTVDPEVRDAALASLLAARNALSQEGSDYEAMLEHVAAVPEEVLEERQVHAYARVLLTKLRIVTEDPAALEKAREANPAGAARLDQLAERVAPKRPLLDEPQAHDGRRIPVRLLQAKLEAAEAARERGEHLEAYETYQWLLERAGDTKVGAQAAERIGEYEADEALLAEVRAQQQEKEARAALTLARNYEAAHRTDLARATYEKIIKTYPKSEAARTAREALAALP